MSSSTHSTGPGSFWRSPAVRRLYPPALLVQVGLHASTLAPAVSRGDAGDIATAAAQLGVMHPTGYPIFTMLAHVFTRLPLDAEPVVAIEIMNVLFMVVATVLIAATVRTLARRWTRGVSGDLAADSTWIAEAAGLFAGLSVALAPAMWEQVRIPEVYPMHVMLVTWACYLWARFDRTREQRYLLLTAIPLGLGLAHHLTIVYLFAATAAYLIVVRFRIATSWLIHPIVWPIVRLARRRRPTLWPSYPLPEWWIPLAVLGIAAVPLLSYAYLWWAASHTSALPWGGTDDWTALWRHATGRQYHGYLKGFGYSRLPERALGLPDRFDQQFLLGALIPALAGATSLARRAPAMVFGLLLYAGLNLQHGLRYSVSDFHVYYLPAFVVFALLFGVGLTYLCSGVGRSGQRVDARYFGLVIALLFATIAASLAYYQVHRPSRLADSMSQAAYGRDVVRGLVFAALAFAVVPHAARWIRARTTRVAGLPWMMLGVTVAAYVPSVALRAHELAETDDETALYARGIVHDVPDGALFLTGGDSYAFPMWYEQHVAGRGRGFAVVNLHMFRYRWYRKDYLLPRHPRACDPYRGTPDPKCDDYAARSRMAGPSWLEFDMRRTRGGVSNRGKAPQAPIIHGGARCQDPDVRRDRKSRCGCDGIDVAPRRWDEVCVETAEDGGIVELTDREVKAHRLIQDHIDDRPVFERNVFSRWASEHKNARDWDGPAYRRPSGDYALVNRGAANQIVHAADLEPHRACAEHLEPVRLRPLSPPDDDRLRLGARSPYRPNPRPTLVGHATMAESRDAPTRPDRRFERGEQVVVRLHWFERYEYAGGHGSHRGRPIRHGVRVCIYDPGGKRVHEEAKTTRGKRGTFAFRPGQNASRGTYTVQACSVGDMRGDPRAGRALTRVPNNRSCERTLLEFEFDIQ